MHYEDRNESYVNPELKINIKLTNTYSQYSLGYDLLKRKPSPEVNKVLKEHFTSFFTWFSKNMPDNWEFSSPIGKIFFNILGKVSRGNSRYSAAIKR